MCGRLASGALVLGMESEEYVGGRDLEDMRSGGVGSTRTTRGLLWTAQLQRDCEFCDFSCVLGVWI